jgi:hypothetical protein
LAKVRENALNLAIDNKAKQILKEKKDLRNEKKYKELLQHQGIELKHRMEDEDVKRTQAKQNVRLASRQVEERSYKAHSRHIDEVKQKYRLKSEEDLKTAQESFKRGHRDMTFK